MVGRHSRYVEKSMVVHHIKVKGGGKLSYSMELLMA